MTAQTINRAKTAIARRDVSRPVRLAIDEGFLKGGDSLFDYGCGRGDDIRLLRAQGYAASGWDPYSAANELKEPASVVNLGYVLNVIESIDERAAALRESWELAQRVLVIAALVKGDDRGKVYEAYADGVVTGSGTFQKYFSQSELKAFIEQTLSTEAIALSVGVFAAFRDESLRQEYLRARFTRPAATPRPKLSQLLYEQHRELLESLANQVADLGRLPEPEEAPTTPQLIETFGSTKRAFAVIRRVTGATQWDEAAARRTDDTILHLALMRFGRRPVVSDLARRMQFDVRAFFGAYTRACERADEALLLAGRSEVQAAACEESPVGKLMPTALYVHISSTGFLPLPLRVLEGCASKYLGIADPGTVIKISRREPVISYLVYPRFFEDAHPTLAGSIRVSLRPVEVSFRNYGNSRNPPILHRKELMLHASHERRAQFASLTGQEEAAGILGAPKIGLLKHWRRALASRHLEIRDHELVERHPRS